MSIRTKIRLIQRILTLLSKRDIGILFLLTLAQVTLGLLDLLGVFLVGLIGTISASSILSSEINENVSKALGILRLENIQFEKQIIYLSVITFLIFIAKTFFSLKITFTINHFLSRLAASQSGYLVSILFSGDLSTLNFRRSQDSLFSVTGGVNLLFLGIITTMIAVISDLFLVLFLSLGLIVVEPIVFVLTSTLFFIVAYLSYLWSARRISKLSRTETDLAIKSNERILSGMLSFRDFTSKGLRANLIEQIVEERRSLARTTANLNFFPTIGKYVIEIALLLGVVIVAITQLSRSTVIDSVGVFSIYLAASSRIAPAALRLQQGVTSLRRDYGSASSSIVYFEFLESLPKKNFQTTKYQNLFPGFSPTIEIKDASFKFHDSDRFLFNRISISVKSGEFLAIIGPTGSGKSSLVDLLLGLQPVVEGSVEISGKSPSECISTWPGSIGYVPQSFYISGATVRDYLTMGYDQGAITDQSLYSALASAQLIDFILEMPEGLDSKVGENGNRLSGGQRQRLGIARALLTEPRLIILDESTSSLDASTETALTHSIQSLKGNRTVIAVAHRLSTVEKADRVIYLDNGVICAEGSLDWVKTQVPELALIFKDSLKSSDPMDKD